MKKIMNRPEAFAKEVLEGIYLAHPRWLEPVDNDPFCVVSANAPIEQKVAIITGGGSGHLPVFLGYVGQGMLDGCAAGDVFQSPTSEQIMAVTRRVHAGRGVLYLYGNYGGDIMNFDMAAETAADEGIQIRTVLVQDDVASAPNERAQRRRGVAGMVFAFKLAGASAELGGDLEEVTRVAQKTLENTRTMGVGLAPCTLPAAGQPTFTLEDNEMELGIGIHGERGVRRGQIEPADQIAEALLQTLLADLPIKAKARVAVMVNGLGATPLEELYILYRRVHALLGEHQIEVHRALVGEYATSLEMAGASLTLLLLDDELTRLLDHPAQTPFFTVTT